MLVDFGSTRGSILVGPLAMARHGWAVMVSQGQPWWPSKDRNKNLGMPSRLDGEGNAKAKGTSGDAVLGAGPWPKDKVELA